MYYFEILDFSLSENQTKKQYTKKIKYQILKNKTKVLFLIQKSVGQNSRALSVLFRHRLNF